jgi:phosphopentomutase
VAGSGTSTVGVGKIGDIFNEQGIGESFHDKGNRHCLERTRDVLRDKRRGDFFMFVNLVDTDMIYGHRRDPSGYYRALREIDDFLPQLTASLEEGDLFIITADHGCDPTFPGSDHTREHVPLLAFQMARPGRNLGVRASFADAAQTIADFFGVPAIENGNSFL